MIDTDKWIESSRVSLDELEKDVKQLREKLNETEYRLEMAEDVLSRSDWNTVYRELIEEVKE